jgi:hypothetical protein
MFLGWRVLPAALAALAISSACSGSAVAPPSAARPPLSPFPSYVTIVPGRHAKSKFFEYIINNYRSYASIFDYPKSDRQVGTIAKVGGQGCTNVLYGYGNKTFWIVAGAHQITEYEVPQKPIKTLSDHIGQPSSCAMNSSGDLAVGILFGSGGGDVVIYQHANGSGTAMSTPLAGEYFDGYDNQGNLFADGFNGNANFELVELPKGRSKFQTISTSNTVRFPGSVQWDGKYVTVNNQLDAIYRYTISGRKATLKSTVHLRGAGDCAQTWIATGVVFCADADHQDGEVFKYPAGGSAIAVFRGNFDFPLGVTAAQE